MEYRLSSLTEFPPFPPLNTPPRTARLIYFPVDRVSRREKEKGAAGLMRSYFDFSTSPRLFFARPPFNRVLGSRSMESYAYSFAEMECRVYIYIQSDRLQRFRPRDGAIISISVDNGQLLSWINGEINRTLALKTCPGLSRYVDTRGEVGSD